jgi:hypothetical protein
MEKRGSMDNENKFYNILELVLVVHAPSFLHSLYIL